MYFSENLIEISDTVTLYQIIIKKYIMMKIFVDFLYTVKM